MFLKSLLELSRFLLPFGSLDKRNPETVTKSELKTSTVTATFGQDFDFDLPLRVQGFKITIEGEGSYLCEGSELSGPAKRAIDRARRNSLVRVSEIRTRAIRFFNRGKQCSSSIIYPNVIKPNS